MNTLIGTPESVDEFISALKENDDLQITPANYPSYSYVRDHWGEIAAKAVQAGYNIRTLPGENNDPIILFEK